MTDCQRLLIDRLRTLPGGVLPFAQVMDFALYDAATGYYGRAPRRIGRSGDFYTAVSVGPLYGRLLAVSVRQCWEKMGCPQDFLIIEQAAHDGQLAEDILTAITAPGDAFSAAARYHIIEPQPAYEAAQHARLFPQWPDRVTWSATSATVTGPAFFLCNELVDALPAHLLRWSQGQWWERGVAVDAADTLRWQDLPISDPELAAEAAKLPQDLPEGFVTEINLAALQWLRGIAAATFTGTVLIADYGLDAEEFWTASRAEGTIRRYANHQMDGDVLTDLGDCDLTAQVNFSQLIEEAEAAGLTVRAYQDQSRFLTHLAADWLRSLDGRPPDADTRAALRQFQTLTHPSLMGRSFRVLMLEKTA
ncbi:MAG: SAM-dependent methyltransferase [Verrucomicrobiales bacterium]|nr:SAM-dependent methyltransferase [Verrucomicrobiales bacterium]